MKLPQIIVVFAVLVLVGCNRDWSADPKPVDDAGPGQADDSGAIEAGTTDATVPLAANVPTVGSFGTVSQVRRNKPAASARVLVLLEDGFEIGPRVCNRAGWCAAASFAP